jgi:hypothetical protein
MKWSIIAKISTLRPICGLKHVVFRGRSEPFVSACGVNQMSRILSLFALTLACGLAVSDQALALDNDAARLATYHSGDTTSFALSLELNKAPTQKRANDIAVFVDTSASQVGLFQEDSIQTLRLLLEKLNDNDRVQLFAVDLDIVPLTSEFVAPNDPQVAAALRELAARAPLGSTDMDQFAKGLPTVFADRTDANRSVVYIGDGVSRGGAVSSAPATSSRYRGRLTRTRTR